MWPNSQEITDLVTFTEEILFRKPHILCSVAYNSFPVILMKFLKFW